MAKSGRQGDGGGRPLRTLTEEQLNKVEGFAAVLTVDQIADYFCMAKKTFYAIMERQPEVALRFNRGRASVINDIGSNLVMQAKEGNLNAQIFYLKTRAGWKETTVVENDNKNELKVNVNLKNDKSE
jgi:hypothetical protein